MDLTNRVALVTGGAHRVGRAIVLALADAGARIALHYNQSAEQAQATLAEVQTRGSEGIVVTGDLTEMASIAHIVEATHSQWGQIDLLVCSAGIWGRMPLDTVTEEQWDNLFALNARSAFFLAQQAAPYLRAANGCIVAITDAGIMWAWKNYTPYLASKAALAGVVQNLARDLAPEVRVNAVAPGPVLLPDDWDTEQAAKSARTTLLKRVGRPEDVADAVVYLARADYVTGVMLPVDGGQRLQ